jgi:hypothetical protein
VGLLRLSFAHHVDRLDPAEDDMGSVNGLEAKHRPHASLDPAMILFDAVVQVAALSDADGLQLAP